MDNAGTRWYHLRNHSIDSKLLQYSNVFFYFLYFILLHNWTDRLLCSRRSYHILICIWSIFKVFFPFFSFFPRNLVFLCYHDKNVAMPLYVFENILYLELHTITLCKVAVEWRLGLFWKTNNKLVNKSLSVILSSFQDSVSLFLHVSSQQFYWKYIWQKCTEKTTKTKRYLMEM